MEQEDILLLLFSRIMKQVARKVYPVSAFPFYKTSGLRGINMYIIIIVLNMQIELSVLPRVDYYTWLRMNAVRKDSGAVFPVFPENHEEGYCTHDYYQ